MAQILQEAVIESRKAESSRFSPEFDNPGDSRAEQFSLSRELVLSIVIPCLNEKDRITQVVSDARNMAGLYGITSEIIVVDDGSSDGTANIALKLGCKVVRHSKNQGIAQAFRSGAMASKGEYVMLCPVDVTSFDFLKEARDLLGKYDILSISKRNPESVVYGYTPIRWLMSNGYHFLISSLFAIPPECTDTHYVKIYNRKLLSKILPHCVANGAVGETEIVVRLCRHGATLRDLSCFIVHDQNQSKTRM